MRDLNLILQVNYGYFILLIVLSIKKRELRYVEFDLIFSLVRFLFGFQNETTQCSKRSAYVAHYE